MFERYTEDARKVIARARQEAQKFNHDHVGTEHLLLGMIEVKEGVAAEVLSHRQINLSKAKEQVAKLVENPMASKGIECDMLPRTEHAQNVLDDAIEEARQLKHNYIGTEHLLLGLLHEKNATGDKVLENLGLKLDDVREDILKHFNRSDSLPA